MTAANIGKGLRLARDQFTRLGRSYAPDVIILISTGDQDEPLEYGNPVTEAAANKSAGRAIFMTKLTVEGGDPARAERLADQIPSDPKEFYYFKDIGTEEDLITYLSTIVRNICSPPNAAPHRNLFTISTPTLTWNRLTWAAGYEVEISRSASSGTQLPFSPLSVSGNVGEITLPSLSNAIYYWRVRARRADGTFGGWSVYDSFVIDVP
jgi:hypothetical protein